MMARTQDSRQRRADDGRVIPFAPPGPRHGSAAAWRAFDAAVKRWCLAAEVERHAAAATEHANAELLDLARLVGRAR